jgi:hypothetical protein
LTLGAWAVQSRNGSVRACLLEGALGGRGDQVEAADDSLLSVEALGVSAPAGVLVPAFGEERLIRRSRLPPINDDVAKPAALPEELGGDVALPGAEEAGTVAVGALRRLEGASVAGGDLVREDRCERHAR